MQHFHVGSYLRSKYDNKIKHINIGFHSDSKITVNDSIKITVNDNIKITASDYIKIIENENVKIIANNK